MAEIVFPCSCGMLLKVYGDDQVGEVIVCPACGGNAVVPAKGIVAKAKPPASSSRAADRAGAPSGAGAPRIFRVPRVFEAMSWATARAMIAPRTTCCTSDWIPSRFMMLPRNPTMSGARERADRRPDASREGHAADDRRGQRVEFEVDACARQAGVHTRHV